MPNNSSSRNRQFFCPECLTPLVIRYDYYKKETTCAMCGLVLRAPPEYGIVYPDVLCVFQD